MVPFQFHTNEGFEGDGPDSAGPVERKSLPKNSAVVVPVNDDDFDDKKKNTDDNDNEEEEDPWALPELKSTETPWKGKILELSNKCAGDHKISA